MKHTIKQHNIARHVADKTTATIAKVENVALCNKVHSIRITFQDTCFMKQNIGSIQTYCQAVEAALGLDQ